MLHRRKIRLPIIQLSVISPCIQGVGTLWIKPVKNPKN